MPYVLTGILLTVQSEDVPHVLTGIMLILQEIAELKTAALVKEQLAARATALCAAAQQSVRLAETAKEAAISCAASADARTAAALRLVRSAQVQCPSLRPLASMSDIWGAPSSSASC